MTSYAPTFGFGRTLAGGFLALGLVFFAALNGAQAGDRKSVEGATAFLKDFGDKAVAMLSQDGLSDTDRNAELRRLIKAGFELPVIGRFFSNRFVIAFDDTEYLFEVQKGKIVRISEGMASNDFGFEFALRASTSAWEKFSQPVPPPMFNDVWAMAHPLHKQLVIDGNQLPFWQNMRALTHMLALMREV